MRRGTKKVILFGGFLLALSFLLLYAFTPSSQPTQTPESPTTITGLNQPFAVALTPNGQFAYVTNGGSSLVSAINTASNTITASIPVGISPFGIAVTPDGKYVYVTNGGSASVSVISTTTNTVLTTIIVGIGPYGVVIAPNGEYAYVSNFGTCTVSVVSTALNMVVETIPVGNSPQGLAITPDGVYVYVSNFGGGTVSVIDTALNSVIATIPVEIGPIDIVTSSKDNNYVYVANSGSGSVSVIDPYTNTVIATATGLSQPSGIALTTDGSYAYVTNLSGDTVTVISTATNMVAATIPVGAGPYGIAITPNGNYAYVINYNSATVSVIETLAVNNTPLQQPLPRLQTSVPSPMPPYTAITPTTHFLLPNCAGCICFGVNATYHSAVFANDTWSFTNLRLTESQLLRSLQISAQNSNLTFLSYEKTQNSTFQSEQLTYTTKNNGTQILTLAIDSQVDLLILQTQWSVNTPECSLVEGKDWNSLDDETIIITNVNGCVNVKRVTFADFFGNGKAYANLPLYEKHTVAIALGIGLSIIVAIAVLAKIRTKTIDETVSRQKAKH
ncbi:MAG: YncE family protein [Nitrososphaerota archaeon]|nr:YncE family protein [Nitrososphaerota archaeon]